MLETILKKIGRQQLCLLSPEKPQKLNKSFFFSFPRLIRLCVSSSPKGEAEENTHKEIDSAYQCKLNKVGPTIPFQSVSPPTIRRPPGPPGNHPTPGGARATERTRKSRLEHPHGQDSAGQPYSPHQNIRVPQIKKRKNSIDLGWDP